MNEKSAAIKLANSGGSEAIALHRDANAEKATKTRKENPLKVNWKTQQERAREREREREGRRERRGSTSN